MSLQPITIVFLTYKRTEYALATIRGIFRHLKYHGDIHWYVADDGSDELHIRSVFDELAKHQANVMGYHSEHISYGAGANKAWRAANELSNLTFWLEDDWELNSDLDLTPYAKVLLDYEDVGMVRLGLLNQYMAGVSVGYGDRLYWRLERVATDNASPVFTGHPSLRHSRYRSMYGEYIENLGPGDTELAYAYRFRIATNGPCILWPAEAGQWGWFGHIGAIKSY